MVRSWPKKIKNEWAEQKIQLHRAFWFVAPFEATHPHTHTRIIESEVLAQCLLVSIMDFHLFDARWLRRQMEISSLFVSAKISRNQLKNITDKIVKLLFLLVSFSFTAQIGRTHGKNIRKNWCGDVDCSVRSDSVHEIFCGVFFYVLATQRQTHLLERLAI